MKLSEKLADAREYMEAHGWQQRSMGIRRDGGSVCLIGAMPEHIDRLRLVIGKGDLHPYLTEAIASLTGFVLEPDQPVYKWNDLEVGVSKARVLEVLQYAEKLAAADGL